MSVIKEQGVVVVLIDKGTIDHFTYKDVMDTDKYRKMAKDENAVLVPLGFDIVGRPVIADFSVFAHGCAVGATRSGKTVAMHTILNALVDQYAPSQLRFMLIDPKRVGLQKYAHFPHMIGEVGIYIEDAKNVLEWVLGEMDKRNTLFNSLCVENIQGYRAILANPEHAKLKLKALPNIIVFIDELAMLTSDAELGEEFMALLKRLVNEAASSGIHCFWALQRATVDVVDGVIKQNTQLRICLKVISDTDIKVALGRYSDEQIIGKGDSLVMMPTEEDLVRTQVANCPDKLIVQNQKNWGAVPKMTYKAPSEPSEPSESTELKPSSEEVPELTEPSSEPVERAPEPKEDGNKLDDLEFVAMLRGISEEENPYVKKDSRAEWTVFEMTKRLVSGMNRTDAATDVKIGYQYGLKIGKIIEKELEELKG